MVFNIIANSLLGFGFLRFPPNKTGRHDITEILLRVGLNIITRTRKIFGLKIVFPVVGINFWSFTGK
jgi:hypothetical protein